MEMRLSYECLIEQAELTKYQLVLLSEVQNME